MERLVSLVVLGLPRLLNIQEEVSGSQVPPAVREPMDVSVSAAWRPWEEKGSESVEDLSQTISELQASVVGSHKEEMPRSISSVKPVPHTSHEIYPSLDTRTKRSIFKGKIEKNLDVSLSSNFQT